MKEYYDRRAPEYDDWWVKAEERDGWTAELDQVRALLSHLEPVRTLEVACGTGYMTQHLPGEIVAIDQSARMLHEARRRLPDLTFVQADALDLPFDDGSFDRLFASYFYCHLPGDDRLRFLAEARRVARELVVMGSRWHEGAQPERWEERVLSDGSTWPVFKRVFEPDALAAELDGEVLHAGHHFVVVRA